MCRIILRAWFWPFITQFMKFFACGGLRISFTLWYFIKKVLSKVMSAAGEKYFWVEVTPLWFEKFTHTPSGKETAPPSGIFDLVHLCTTLVCNSCFMGAHLCRLFKFNSYFYPRFQVRSTHCVLKFDAKLMIQSNIKYFATPCNSFLSRSWRVQLRIWG